MSDIYTLANRILLILYRNDGQIGKQQLAQKLQGTKSAERSDAVKQLEQDGVVEVIEKLAKMGRRPLTYKITDTGRAYVKQMAKEGRAEI